MSKVYEHEFDSIGHWSQWEEPSNWSVGEIVTATEMNEKVRSDSEQLSSDTH